MTTKHRISSRVYLVNFNSDSIVNWGTYPEMVEQLDYSYEGLAIVDFLDLTAEMKQQAREQ